MDTRLRVSLGEVGADDLRLDLLHRQVREDLREVEDLDVRAWQDSDATSIQAGTRSLGPAEISALSVAVLGSGGLTALVTALRAWLGRGHVVPRTVRLEIDGDCIVLEGADTDERERLLRVFLDRHASAEGS